MVCFSALNSYGEEAIIQYTKRDTYKTTLQPGSGYKHILTHETKWTSQGDEMTGIVGMINYE